jgi:Transglycosylase SLT domain
MPETIPLDPLKHMIINEALDAGVNPGLALALGHWESAGLNPNAVSPTGVTGLFQVTNDTGAGYGQTPATRTDPQVSARAGIRYFRDLLDQNGGDVQAALMRYNGGSDPRFAQRVLSVYPQYAQFSTFSRQAPAQAQGQPQADLSSRLDAIDAKLGGGAPAPQAPAAQAPASAQTSPAAGQSDLGTRLDAIDARFRPQGAAPAGGQAPAPESYSPMLRNSAVAPSGQMPAAPGVPEENIPYSGGPRVTIDIAKPSSSEPAPPATPPPSGQAQAPGWLEWAAGYLGGAAQRQAQQAGVALPPGGGMPTPEAQQAGVEQFLKPSEVSGKQLAGMGVQAVTTAAGAAAGAPLAGLTGGASIPIGAGIGSYYGHRLNQELGLTPGKRAGVLPQTFEDYVSLAPMLPAAIPAAQGLARLTRAGRAITEADTATKTALQAYNKTFHAQQAEFEEAVKGIDVLGKERLRSARTAADEATQAALRAWETQGQDAYDTALTNAKTAQQTYATLLEEAKQANAAHTAAVAGTEAIPGRMQPSTPSRDLYQQFADVSKGKSVDLTPATTVTTKLQDVLPYASPELQAAVKELQSLGPTATAERVHDLRKVVGDIYANSDKRTKGYAAQIFGGLKEAINTSLPGEAPLLAQADTIWKQEQGVKALQEALKRRAQGSIISMNERGEKVLNVKALLNQVERPQVMDWFTPQEQAALRADIQQFVGTPGRQGPVPKTGLAQDAAPLPGTMSMKGMERPTPTEPEYPKPMTYPTAPTYTPPAEVPPVVSSTGLKGRAAGAVPLIASQVIAGQPHAALMTLGGLGLDATFYALSKGLVDSRMRPLLLKWMQTGGPMSQELYGALGALASTYDGKTQQGRPPTTSGYEPPRPGMPTGLQGGATR